VTEEQIDRIVDVTGDAIDAVTAATSEGTN
jgi:hypothetical protein